MVRGQRVVGSIDVQGWWGQMVCPGVVRSSEWRVWGWWGSRGWGIQWWWGSRSSGLKGWESGGGGSQGEGGLGCLGGDEAV